MQEFDLNNLVQIAIALSAEKDIDKLLARILREAMDYCSCDAGTVYIRERDELLFYHTVTRSKGVCLSAGNGELSIPPVPMTRSHICACAALDKRLINIGDVYTSEEFSFDGAKKYDELNGYRTTSMLVVPMEDEKGEVIGVMQLINALDGSGNITFFPEEKENIIAALSSLAAVSINNRRLAQTVINLLHSFIQVMVKAIDMRSPYNASHTRSMVRYAERFIRWLKETGRPEQLKDDDEDAFLMSVWMHDIGKLIVPLEIMDKSTRLGGLAPELFHRIEVAGLCEEIRGLRCPEELEDSVQRRRELEQARDLIEASNTQGRLDPGTITALRALAGIRCLTPEGERIPLLTDREMEAITIPKGTLTEDERRQMEEHVVYTSNMLSEMKLEGVFEKVPVWASNHHELMDGSGYPAHKTAEALPKEVRILTIIDIYDALTAEDRPYKPPMSPEVAFDVLEGMTLLGKLDAHLLALFKESGAWKRD